MQDDGVGWLDRRSFTVGAIAAAATTFYPDRVMSERLPMIVVDQLDALMDAPIAIELRGFAPRQAIALTATQIFPSHSRWQARDTFMSDDRATSASRDRRRYWAVTTASLRWD